MDRVSVFIVGLCLAGMVSGKDKNISAVIGGNVTLPCEAKESFKSVDWSRPNGTETEFILLIFRGNETDKSETPERYQGRVEFKDPHNGNMSLVLKNVKPEDEGRYGCRVEKAVIRRKRSNYQPTSTFYLDVRHPSGKIGLIVGLLVAAVALIAVVAAFVLEKKKQRSSPPPPDKEAEKPLQIPPTAADPSIP